MPDSDGRFDVRSVLREHQDAAGRRLAVSWRDFYAGTTEGLSRHSEEPWMAVCNSDGTLHIRNRGWDDVNWNLDVDPERPPIYGNPIRSGSAEVKARAMAVWSAMVDWVKRNADLEALQLAQRTAPFVGTAAAYNVILRNASFRSLAGEAPMAAAMVFEHAFRELRGDVQEIPEESLKRPPVVIITEYTGTADILARVHLDGLLAVDEWARTVDNTLEFGQMEYPSIWNRHSVPVLLERGTRERVRTLTQACGAKGWWIFHNAAPIQKEYAGAILEDPVKTIRALDAAYPPEVWKAGRYPPLLYADALEEMGNVGGHVSPDRFVDLLRMRANTRQRTAYRAFEPSPADGVRVGDFTVVQLKDTFALGAQVNPQIGFDNERASEDGIRIFNVVDSWGNVFMTMHVDRDYELISYDSAHRVSLTVQRSLMRAIQEAVGMAPSTPDRDAYHVRGARTLL